MGSNGRAIQRLDLALFIDAKHQSALRRVEVEANNVTHLLNELRISRELESLAAMWGQRESVPDAMHGRNGKARRLCHRARAPMRRVGRHRLQRLRHDLGDLLVSDLARRAAARLVIEAIQTPRSKPLAPCQNRHPGDADFIGDGTIVQTICRQKNNFGPHRIRPRDLATPYPRFQLEALLLAEDDFYRRRPSHGSLRIISIQRSNHDTAQMPRNFGDGTLGVSDDCSPNCP
jgi:hypothetical protein